MSRVFAAKVAKQSTPPYKQSAVGANATPETPSGIDHMLVECDIKVMEAWDGLALLAEKLSPVISVNAGPEEGATEASVGTGVCDLHSKLIKLHAKISELSRRVGYIRGNVEL